MTYVERIRSIAEGLFNGPVPNDRLARFANRIYQLTASPDPNANMGEKAEAVVRWFRNLVFGFHDAGEESIQRELSIEQIRAAVLAARADLDEAP